MVFPLLVIFPSARAAAILPEHDVTKRLDTYKHPYEAARSCKWVTSSKGSRDRWGAMPRMFGCVSDITLALRIH